MSKKRGASRSEYQREADRAFIAKHMLQGYTVRAIADMLNERNQKANSPTVVHTQVFYDMKKILKEWQEDRVDMIDHVVDRELAKLDVIEKECWLAWENSKQGRKKVEMDGGRLGDGKATGGKITKRTLEESNGDPRYLDKILDCMDRRKELLGYGAAKKIEFSGNVAVGTSYMDRSEVEKEKERIYKNMRVIDSA